MVNKKSQNSIVFLTTLGVYLGLLMVGASPGVLAQQGAMTRNFELSEEVELTDDLDENPQPNDLDDLVLSYFRHVEDFVRNLKALRSIDKLDSTSDSFNVSKVSYLPCPETGTQRSHEIDSHIDPWILPAIIEVKLVTESLARFGECLPFYEIPNRTEARSSGVQIVLDKDEFLIESSVFLTGDRSEPFYKRLLESLERYEVEADANAELNQELLKNTSVRKSGTNVMIVTRLPRAALDALLATNAK